MIDTLKNDNNDYFVSLIVFCFNISERKISPMLLFFMNDTKTVSIHFQHY